MVENIFAQMQSDVLHRRALLCVCEEKRSLRMACQLRISWNSYN